MCGIAGYVGDRESADVLVDALSKLEYRGYDSAGIAVFDHGNIKVKKCKGRLANLVEKMDEEGKPQGHVGIGHTRWATHGEPSDINSCTAKAPLPGRRRRSAVRPPVRPAPTDAGTRTRGPRPRRDGA